MQVLRQSTQIIVRIGPAVAVADGFTPVTTLALATADEAELLKANTATTTDISGATMAAITGCDGWYALTLTTALTDTVGCLDVMINDDSLILPIYARFQVIEEAAYDAMYAASAAPATAAAVAAVKAETALIVEDTGTTIPASLTTIDNEIGAIDTVVDAILVDTAEIGAAGAGLTALSTQVSVNDLPTNAELATALGTADDAVLAAIAALNNFDPTTDTVLLATGGITATTIADGAIDAAALSTDAAQEIRDAILAGEITELTTDPGASPALEEALALLYMAVRNKRDTTATSDEIHNDAGAVVLVATLSDDGAVFSKAEYAAPA